MEDALKTIKNGGNQAERQKKRGRLRDESRSQTPGGKTKQKPELTAQNT